MTHPRIPYLNPSPTPTPDFSRPRPHNQGARLNLDQNPFDHLAPAARSTPNDGRSMSPWGWKKGSGGTPDSEGDDVDGLGLGMRGFDVPHDSPTHAYLETFDSYRSRPNPSHSPIPYSPSMTPTVDEKDPLGEGRFGMPHQYTSDHFLVPTLHAEPSPYGGRSDLSGASAPGGKYKQPRTCLPSNPRKRRWILWGIPSGIFLSAAIAIAVIVAVLRVGMPNSSPGSKSSSDTSGSATGSAGNPSSTSASGNGTSSANTTTTDFGVAGTGASGSTVTTDLGVQFTYVNGFGGNWAQNPDDPYSVSGQAQSWSPSLLEDWTWGQDTIRGVNLGGWLVTEPFIAPALYEAYPGAVDEYTLSVAMGSDLATKMEQHYSTFITEEDFAEVAAAGLNWVRIAVGFWAIETIEDEPFLEHVSWTYFTKAIGWARKYGIRIYLDFHALPGSQNGWNHSGKGGPVNWMYGVMGLANAQRSLEYIRSFVEYLSQPGIKEVVPMLDIVNEVTATQIGLENLQAFYYQAYQLIRGITGYGAGNGPIIALHEGFLGIELWQGFLSGADRLAIDQHPYLAFGVQNNNGWDANAKQACGWGGGTNDTQTAFGLVIGGEWSTATNDCGLWLNGVGSTPSYDAIGSCNATDEYWTYDADTKAGILSYAQSNMDALQNWFFWTWKIGNSTTLGYPSSPMWHYRLGLQEGWIPSDPRVAGGYCGTTMGVSGDQFSGVFPASAIGGVAAPTIAADQVSNHSVWPPTAIGPSPSFGVAQIALFPTYTQTGTPIVLATPTHPAAAASIGNGWADSNDKVGAWVTVAGCSYPDQYNATAASLLPTAVCTGNPAKRAFEARITGQPRV